MIRCVEGRKRKSQAHFVKARMGKGILNKWVQLELLKATKDFLLWYIFSGGSIGWCGMSFLHGAVKILEGTGCKLAKA